MGSDTNLVWETPPKTASKPPRGMQPPGKPDSMQPKSGDYRLQQPAFGEVIHRGSVRSLARIVNPRSSLLLRSKPGMHGATLAAEDNTWSGLKAIQTKDQALGWEPGLIRIRGLHH